MAKKRYLYAHKKSLKNLQEDDFNYFYSPKYAKIIAERYGMDNNGVEDAFKMYFNALKDFGLIEHINKHMFRRNVESMFFQKYRTFGENTACVGAATSFENEISIRNSFRKGDFTDLFHEFNHLILMQEEKLAHNKFAFSTGFNEEIVQEIRNDDSKKIMQDEDKIIYQEINRFMGFNEGVTELLANMLVSKIQKKPVVSKAYFDGVGNVKMLYNIVGPALFKAYVQGNFDVLERSGGGITSDQFKALADLFDPEEEFENPEDYFDNDFEIKLALIQMLQTKIKNDAKNVHFESYEELEKAIGKAYTIFAGSARFSDKRNSVETLRNKPDFLDELTESFVNTVVEISEDKGIEVELDDERIDSYFETFKFYNENEYFLVYANEPYLDLEKFKNEQCIYATNSGKAEYIRKKGKIDYGIDHNILEQANF